VGARPDGDAPVLQPVTRIIFPFRSTPSATWAADADWAWGQGQQNEEGVRRGGVGEVEVDNDGDVWYKNTCPMFLICRARKTDVAFRQNQRYRSTIPPLPQQVGPPPHLLAARSLDVGSLALASQTE
jgi:hypothetical protein